jgi:hypothetical protein
MFGMGVAFAAVMAVVLGTLAAISLAVEGWEEWKYALDSTAMGSFWGFLIGVIFGGSLALVGRRQSFESLSLLRFTGMGAGAGLFLFGLLALVQGVWEAWFAPMAAIFMVMGGVSATSALLIARKAEGVVASEGEGKSPADDRGAPALDAGEQVPHPLSGNEARQRARP